MGFLGTSWFSLGVSWASLRGAAGMPWCPGHSTLQKWKTEYLAHLSGRMCQTCALRNGECIKPFTCSTAEQQAEDARSASKRRMHWNPHYSLGGSLAVIQFIIS